MHHLFHARVILLLREAALCYDVTVALRSLAAPTRGQHEML
jgi:hypothetical protein